MSDHPASLFRVRKVRNQGNPHHHFQTLLDVGVTQ